MTRSRPRRRRSAREAPGAVDESPVAAVTVVDLGADRDRSQPGVIAQRHDVLNDDVAVEGHNISRRQIGVRLP